MSAGRKESPDKSVSPRQRKTSPVQPATEILKDAVAPTDSSTKSDKPERKVEFAQGTYYRQGVRVPAGSQKNPLARTRSR